MREASPKSAIPPGDGRDYDEIRVRLATPEDLDEHSRTTPTPIPLPDHLQLVPWGRRPSLGMPRGSWELDYAMVPAKALLTFGEKAVTSLVQLIKWLTQKWFTHVLLVLVILGYAALGGLLFRYVEAPHEEHARADVQRLRQTLFRGLRELIVNRTVEEVEATDWEREADALLAEYETQLAAFFAQGLEPDREVWSFVGATFYSGTIFTTIGYGHIVPNTDTGRALTMVYAAVGIPLLLMVLADLGKVFTRTIKFLWAFVRRFYYTGSCKAVRRAAPVKAVGKVFHHLSGRGAAEDVAGWSESADPPPFAVDETFDLPVSVALVLLLLYILAGGLMFFQWEEDWSFFQAVYFVFISLSTIGFGDFVPTHPAFMMATFVYLLFGLALTSMCINVVQESLSHTFKKATAKLSCHIGLSLEGTGDADREGATNVELASVHKGKMNAHE